MTIGRWMAGCLAALALTAVIVAAVVYEAPAWRSEATEAPGEATQAIVEATEAPVPAKSNRDEYEEEKRRLEVLSTPKLREKAEGFSQEPSSS